MSQSLAMVFPGQGSQAVGMLQALAEHTDIVSKTFAEASDALGYDLWAVVSTDPNGELNQTHVTQPALLTASVAVYRALLDASNTSPSIMAGHSLGEYSALTCAGVFNLPDAVRLVRARGEYMQTAVPTGVGAMYAIIGLDDANIEQICAQVSVDTGEVVAAVNYNSPGQVVIAGNAAAVETAGALCKEAGAKRALPLPVSVPSHCALMQPAAEKLAVLLKETAMSAPNIPVINNVDVTVVTDVDGIRDALVRQLYCPVQWTKTIEMIAGQGVENVYEIGPGKVLTGLNKRIVKGLNCESVNAPEHLQIG